jgi:hypothetical protein
LAAYGDAGNVLGIAVGDGKITVWRRENNEHKRLRQSMRPIRRPSICA